MARGVVYRQRYTHADTHTYRGSREVVLNDMGRLLKKKKRWRLLLLCSVNANMFHSVDQWPVHECRPQRRNVCVRCEM